jgi:hypothetical protein
MTLTVSMAVVLLFPCFGIDSVAAADRDVAQWSLINLTHRFNDDWGAAAQAEIRFDDHISRKDELVLKPAVFYYFSDDLSVALGYKHIRKWNEEDEHDIWQEVYYRHKTSDLALTHQVRLEERFINGISGVIPRVRYLLAASYPLNANLYLAASEAVRVNLVDKDTGPVKGFEQNRLYGGLGFHVTPLVRLEFGYLWRYERERTGPNASDSVVRFQILINTDGRD